jgi:hypothetical protein
MVDIELSKEDIEELIEEKFDEEEMTEKERDEALNDLKLGDYEAYTEDEGENTFVYVDFEFANVYVNKYVHIDGVTIK